MQKTVLLLLISTRNKNAAKVQALLSEYGCLIKTRLGLHETSEDKCSSFGFLVLELTGDMKSQETLAKKLSSLSGVSVKMQRLKAK